MLGGLLLLAGGGHKCENGVRSMAAHPGQVSRDQKAEDRACEEKQVPANGIT